MSEENIIQKNEYQAQILTNRVLKRYKHLRKWAKRVNVSCYRLYDKDIPEIPVALDLYQILSENGTEDENYLRFYLYERPYEKSDEEEDKWIFTMISALSKCLEIPFQNILVRKRKRQRGNLSQYEKDETVPVVEGVIREQGLLFKVNLSAYLDTGIFFDHRPLRDIVRSQAKDKRVLNLFCYTGSFSVYSADGGASSVDSVDLSNTYLAWAKDNFKLNGFSDEAKYNFIRSDVAEFLEGTKKSWDIIVLDPPTFSNSKNTKDLLDINKDWIKLVSSCLNLLNPNGVLYFSTNSRQLNFDTSVIPEKTSKGLMVSYSDITNQTIPEDFRNTKIHRCWKFVVE